MQINDTSNDATALVLRASSDYKTGYMWQFTRKKGGLARHTRTNGKFNKLDGDGAVPYSFKAVSYTHLDVYKRQEKYRYKNSSAGTGQPNRYP